MTTEPLKERPEWERIVVPLDGSAFAEAALPLAAAVAREARGVLYLVRVHMPLTAVGLAETGAPIDPQWEADVRQAEREYLSHLARSLLENEGVHAETRLLEGPVSVAIRDLVPEVGAGLIVLTTHGRTGVSRSWLGSTADWLVRFAPAPVLLVRPPQDGVLRPTPPSFTHVLVALDGSERAEAVIPEAVRLGRIGGARYTLLRVVEPVVRPRYPYGIAMPSAEPDEVATSEVVERAEAYLNGVRGRLLHEHPDLDVRVEALVGEHPAEVILERARNMPADLIATTTRGRGASRLFLGSVADKVLRGFHGVMLLMGPIAAREVLLAETGFAEQVGRHTGEAVGVS